METIFIITIAVVIFALLFDFINGFHDTANAIATSVSTRAIPPRVAVLMAASMNFLGALTFVGVAKVNDKLIILLDIERLLSFEEMSVLERIS